MKRILVASDLSERSRLALQRAVALAGQFSCELVALHVADDDRPGALIDAERRSAEAALREVLDAAGAGGLAPKGEVMIRVGDPFKVIAEEADRVDADLIVMGAHRKRLLGDVFTGTTIERVIRLGSRPVLMVNRDNGSPYGQVLVAVDLSEASAHALRTAKAIGLLDPARAAAVHGFLPLAEDMMYYANVDGSQIREHVAVSASEARSAVGGFLRDAGCGDLADVLLVEKGGAYKAVESGVEKFSPDLLVVGARGHSGLRRLLLGSVADEILRRIDTDILVVPLSGGAQSAGGHQAQDLTVRA